MNKKKVLTHILTTLVAMVCLLTETRAFNGNGSSPDGQQKKEVKLPPAMRPSVDTVAQIRRRGELRVGLALFTPWSIRKKDGELIGYEIDLARKMAEDLGVKVRFAPVPSSELINDLIDDRFDIIITGLYVTPQRALFINFSEPSGHSEVTILASRKESSRRKAEDFNKAGVKLGAVTGTVYADLARSRFPAAALQTFAEEAEMISALEKGSVQAVIVTHPIPEIVTRHHTDKFHVPLSEPLATFSESFAIRKGDPDFLNYVNTWLRYYNETGWLKERRKHWFRDMKWTEGY